MALVVNNMQVFLAAYAGAAAGMGASNRVPTAQSGIAQVNVNIANVAGAYAIEFDALFAAAGIDVDCLSTNLITSLTIASWQERNAAAFPANIQPVFFASQVSALLGIIVAAENYATAQGLDLPSCCCSEEPEG
jgi:hypothetical protein